MLALGAGIETLQALGDGLVHTLVETGLEMQAVEFGQAAPVASIEAVATDQAEGHGHRPAALARQHHADRARHALGQQAEEVPGQVGRLAAHLVGIGVAEVDEVPLRLAEPGAFAPVELDALPGHLLALLADLLALARTEAVEEILEIPVTPVAPVVLAAEALQPACAAAQQLVGGRVGEVDVQAGQPLALQALAQGIEQLAHCQWIAEQARTADRGKRNGAQQLGVIGDTGAPAGIRPAVIEHVLAVGVALHIGWQCGPGTLLLVEPDLVGRLPAALAADTAAVLESREKGMAQERLVVGQQGVPDGGRQVAEVVQGGDWHGRSLACCPGEKKVLRGIRGTASRQSRAGGGGLIAQLAGVRGELGVVGFEQRAAFTGHQPQQLLARLLMRHTPLLQKTQQLVEQLPALVPGLRVIAPRAAGHQQSGTTHAIAEDLDQRPLVRVLDALEPGDLRTYGLGLAEILRLVGEGAAAVAAALGEVVEAERLESSAPVIMG